MAVAVTVFALHCAGPVEKGGVQRCLGCDTLLRTGPTYYRDGRYVSEHRSEDRVYFRASERPDDGWPCWRRL